MSTSMEYSLTMPGTETFGSFLAKVNEWMKDIESGLEDYEIGSISLTFTAVPSATITIVKKGASVLAIPAS